MNRSVSVDTVCKQYVALFFPFPFSFTFSKLRSGALLSWWRIDEASGQLESNE